MSNLGPFRSIFKINSYSSEGYFRYIHYEKLRFCLQTTNHAGHKVELYRAIEGCLDCCMYIHQENISFKRVKNYS
jgi:hypothetical protein